MNKKAILLSILMLMISCSLVIFKGYRTGAENQLPQGINNRQLYNDTMTVTKIINEKMLAEIMVSGDEGKQLADYIEKYHVYKNMNKYTDAEWIMIEEVWFAKINYDAFFKAKSDGNKQGIEQYKKDALKSSSKYLTK